MILYFLSPFLFCYWPDWRAFSWHPWGWLQAVDKYPFTHFMRALKSVQARDLTNIGAAMQRIFSFLHVQRLSVDIDRFGKSSCVFKYCQILHRMLILRFELGRSCYSPSQTFWTKVHRGWLQDRDVIPAPLIRQPLCCWQMAQSWRPWCSFPLSLRLFSLVLTL